jgi:hypothetical protein
MHYEKLTEEILAKGLASSSSKTPAASLNAMIAVDIKLVSVLTATVVSLLLPKYYKATTVIIAAESGAGGLGAALSSLPLAGALAGATGIQTPADKIMVTFAPPPRCGRGPSRGRAERWGMGQADDRVPRSRRPPNLIAGAGRIVRVNFAGGQQCFSAERVSAPSRGRARS